MLKVSQGILVLAVLAIILSTLSIAFYSSPQPDGPKEQQTAAEQNPEQQEQKKSIPPSTFWNFLFPDSISVFTFWLVIATLALAVVAVLQIGFLGRQEQISATTAQAAKDSADAAIEGNRVSRAAMIADQRPWVSLEVEIAGPLAYDDKRWNAGTRWHIPLSYRMQNLGKTPGINVSFFGEIIPFIIPHFPPNKIKDGIPQGTPEPGTDIASEFENVCNFSEQMAAHNMGWGQVLFPNERWPQDGKKLRIFGMNGNPEVFESAKINAGYTGQFLVVVCATYGSTLSMDKYRTAKAFLLFKPDGGINLAGETVLEGTLGFELSPTNGSYAQ